MADQLIKNLINHNEFYGKGFYHKAIYHGSELIWEKKKKGFAYMHLCDFEKTGEWFIFGISDFGNMDRLLVADGENTGRYKCLQSIPANGGSVSLSRVSSPSTVAGHSFVDGRIVFYTDHLTQNGEIYVYLYEVADDLSYLEKISSMLQNGSHIVGGFDALIMGSRFTGCTLSNGFTFLGFAEDDLQAYGTNANLLNADLTYESYMCPYVCFDENFLAAYAVSEPVSLNPYVYANFVTNKEKNRMWGIRWGVGESTVVEFEIPSELPHITDDLLIKKTLFQSAEGIRQKVWLVNDHLFFTTGSGAINWVDVDTGESGNLIYSNSQAIQIVHFYSGVYYFLIADFSEYKAVIASSADLKAFAYNEIPYSTEINDEYVLFYLIFNGDQYIAKGNGIYILDGTSLYKLTL